MKASHLLIGFGFLCILFSLARTYHLLRVQRRERREAMDRTREALRRLQDATVDPKEPEGKE